MLLRDSWVLILQGARSLSDECGVWSLWQPGWSLAPYALCSFRNSKENRGCQCSTVRTTHDPDSVSKDQERPLVGVGMHRGGQEEIRMPMYPCWEGRDLAPSTVYADVLLPPCLFLFSILTEKL